MTRGLFFCGGSCQDFGEFAVFEGQFETQADTQPWANSLCVYQSNHELGFMSDFSSNRFVISN
jgi:hypothetical protein